ncbi:lysosomal alpha-mannosidase-like [Amblyomma americanum]
MLGAEESGQELRFFSPQRLIGAFIFEVVAKYYAKEDKSCSGNVSWTASRFEISAVNMRVPVPLLYLAHSFVVQLLLMSTSWRCPPALAANECERMGCPATKRKYINVHLLSHSHNDAGWYLPVDDMYSLYVNSIYNTTLEALYQNPRRRYVSAESLFFSCWWKEQPFDVRKKVRRLVRTGQLQFVGGGWVQNDEAVTHYTASIDQMTLGLRFLNATFGPECGVPSVAWQADPFGHSISQAALFSRMAFSSVMLGRISWEKKEEWEKARAMEFVWEVDSRQHGKYLRCILHLLLAGGDGAHIFAWVPENRYESPEALCFEVPCESDLWAAPKFLVDYARTQARVYTNDTVAVMSGGDHTFTTAKERFEWQETVLRAANSIGSKKGRKPRVNVVYSTPACYVEALHAARRGWPHFQKDLLPYSDKPGRTWTGFYTTRPNLKMMGRYANGFLQACKQLSVLGRKDTTHQVRKLAEAVATLQHHDGITGTCSETVAKDYANRLYQGIQECERVISASVLSLMNSGNAEFFDHSDRLRFCHLLNQSDCYPTLIEKQFGVIVYNPASVTISHYVRLPLRVPEESKVTVIGPGGVKIESQVLPLAPHPHQIPESMGFAKSSLAFRVDVEPIGASFYRVYCDPPADEGLPKASEAGQQDNFIENERYRVELDPDTGLVSAVFLRDGERIVKLRQTFAAYIFKDKYRRQDPGHYVFTTYTKAEETGQVSQYRTVKGPVVQEIHQVFNEYISQVITLHKGSPFIEFTWTVGPLTKLTDGDSKVHIKGCDVITQFQSDLRSEGFYTDSNGWKNMRRTATITTENLAIPSSYYPVVSWIYIKDRSRNLQMVIFPDRTQGGTSLQEGHLELMVHRQHSTNDELGLPEALKETGIDNEGIVSRGTHRLFLGSPQEAASLIRLQALQLVYKPVLLFAPAEWEPIKETFTALKSPLPITVHVLTLERVSSSHVLLRLEHLGLQKGSVTVNVTQILAGHRLTDVRPVTLGANRYLPGPARHRWPTSQAGRKPRVIQDLRMTAPYTSSVHETGDTVVRLERGQIGTFLALLIAD